MTARDKEPAMRTPEQARAYAAEVLQRPKPCQCEQCRMARTLPAVQRILEQVRKNPLT